MPHRSVFLSAALLGVFVAVLRAQDNANMGPPSEPALKTTTRAVVIDVIVLETNGTSVANLQQRDFRLLEDGKPQTIDFFEEHAATNAAAVKLPPLPPHVYTNEPMAAPSESINVLLLDRLNTEQADQEYAHKQILGFLSSLPPGARVAVYVLNTRLALLQGFTSDGTLLRAAIDSSAAAPGRTVLSRSRQDTLLDKEDVSMAGDAQSAQAEARSLNQYASTQQAETASSTLTALQNLARSLEAIPGRKNLIWFASKFPVALYPEGDNRALLPTFRGHNLPQALRDTVDMLTRARVALYPVSARGLMDDRTMNADSSGQPNGDNFERNPQKRRPQFVPTPQPWINWPPTQADRQSIRPTT